ncbi:MAG: metallophosphoesterase [Lachnospiraceae bacterium]
MKYVIGDPHGCLLEFLELKERIQKKDDQAEFFLVGDIIDRGPKVWEFLEWAMENVTPNGRIQMILGNHEDMVINWYYDKYCHWFRKTGGEPKAEAPQTKYDFSWQLMEHGKVTPQEIAPYIHFFQELPLYIKTAVIGPDGNEHRYVIAHAWFEEDAERDTLIWERKKAYQGYEDKSNATLIHGHTPTVDEEALAMGATNGKVWCLPNNINIDCGLVYRTQGYPKGNLAAICLETLEITYLYE